MTQTLEPAETLTDIRPGNFRWWMQISVALLVLVELGWILPWFNMVTQISAIAPLWKAGCILGGIMMVSFIAGTILENLRVIRSLQLALVGLILVFSAAIAENLLIIQPIAEMSQGLARLDPGAVLILFFVIWMWWRGISLSQGGIRPFTVWRRFEFGLLLFMGYIFIAGRVGFVVPGFDVFILFLLTGLLAVVIARVAYVGMTKGVHKNPFDLRWFASVSGVIAAVVFFSAFAGGLLSGQYRSFLDFLGELVKWGIAVVVFIAGIPGLLVSTFLLPILPWLKSLFSSDQGTSPPEYLFPEAPSFFPGQEEVPNLPLNLQAVIFWGLILILIIALISRLRRLRSVKPLNEMEQPESLLKEGEARKVLQNNLLDLFESLAAGLKPARRGPTAVRIRQIYQQLMQLNAELDRAKLPQQTPLEFLPEMGKIFNHQMDDLKMITYAYNQVRYGELPEILLEPEEIELAWKNVQAEGKRLKKSGLGKLITAETETVERGRV